MSSKCWACVQNQCGLLPEGTVFSSVTLKASGRMFDMLVVDVKG
jgi:hypothetical protein